MLLILLTQKMRETPLIFMSWSFSTNKGDPLKLTAQMLIPRGFRFSFALNETRESFLFAKKKNVFQVIDIESPSPNSSLK